MLSKFSARLEPDSVVRVSQPSFVIRKGDSRKMFKRWCKGDNLCMYLHISVLIYVSFYITVLCRNLAFYLFEVSTLGVE